MNILLLGGGGREHAIAWKLACDNSLQQANKLWIAPGNAGTELCGTNVNISVNDFEAIKHFVIKNNIQMVIVGPENPLVNGIHDYFLNDEILKKISVIGPQKAGAQIEGSKDFAKNFMTRHNIPTANYKTFSKNNLSQGLSYLETIKPPYVLKADGLAAGKGVLICDTIEQAKKELKNMIELSKFGEASNKVVIEEFLNGIELSVFVVTDGKSYKILPVAKDYKKIGDNDTGPNTGGMGAISHVPFADKTFMDKVEKRIIIPTVNGLKKENIPYKGFIYFALINVDDNPFVIEYNARMGDPEAEVVIPRIKSDLLDLFKGIANETLSEKNLETDSRYTSTVMLVSNGYPEKYEKGKEIYGIDKVSDSIIFYSGVTKNNSDTTGTEKIYTNGGRVLAITSYGNTIEEALEKSYKNAKIIDFKGKYYRKDIGKDIGKDIISVYS